MINCMALGLIAVLLVLGGCSGRSSSSASSGGWPAKTIQVYLPFNAGGDTDLHCRKICELIAPDLGVPVVVTNMSGSAGMVAARYVKDSAPDGSTVLFSQSTFLVASLIGVADFSYKDLEVACTVVEDNSSILVVNKKLGKFKTIEDFIQYGKDHPKDILYATSIGGHSQVQGYTVADALGIEITPVDIGGTAEVIPSILNGDCDFALGIYGTYNAYVESGDFDVLAVLSPERLPTLPDVPTISELGVPYHFTKLFGYYFPKGTDQAIIQKWNNAVEKAVNSPEYAKYCKTYYVTPIFRGGQAALDYHNEQYAIIEPYKSMMVGQVK
jgi:tripartite-type tricarboxylate transporter receptor subunit TctC